MLLGESVDFDGRLVELEEIHVVKDEGARGGGELAAWRELEVQQAPQGEQRRAEGGGED